MRMTRRMRSCRRQGGPLVPGRPRIRARQPVTETGIHDPLEGAGSPDEGCGLPAYARLAQRRWNERTAAKVLALMAGLMIMRGPTFTIFYVRRLILACKLFFPAPMDL